MSTQSNSSTGKIVWIDLTVENATEIRDFYSSVVGWKWQDHGMGNYNDFDIQTPGGESVTGICHARGSNAALPPYWLIYIRVEDVKASAGRCVEQGGRVLDGPRMMGANKFCVIQDPAGAVAALIE